MDNHSLCTRNLGWARVRDGRKDSHGFFPTDAKFTEGTNLRTRQLDAVWPVGSSLYNKVTTLRDETFYLPSTIPLPSGVAAQQEDCVWQGWERPLRSSHQPWPSLWGQRPGIFPKHRHSCIPRPQHPWDTGREGVWHHGHSVDDAKQATHTHTRRMWIRHNLLRERICGKSGWLDHGGYDPVSNAILSIGGGLSRTLSCSPLSHSS